MHGVNPLWPLNRYCILDFPKFTFVSCLYSHSSDSRATQVLHRTNLPCTINASFIIALSFVVCAIHIPQKLVLSAMLCLTWRYRPQRWVGKCQMINYQYIVGILAGAVSTTHCLRANSYSIGRSWTRPVQTKCTQSTGRFANGSSSCSDLSSSRDCHCTVQHSLGHAWTHYMNLCGPVIQLRTKTESQTDFYRVGMNEWTARLLYSNIKQPLMQYCKKWK